MKEKVEKRKQEIIEKGRKEQEAVQKKEETKKKKKLTKAEKKKENGIKSAQPVVVPGDNIPKKNPNNVKPVIQNNTQSLPQKKKQPKPIQKSSFCGKFFRIVRLFLILGTISIVVLRVADREKFNTLCEEAGKSWNSFVLLLPPQVVTYGRQAADLAVPLLSYVWTQLLYVGNQMAIKVHEGYSWLKSNENSQYFVVQAESMWAILCERVSDLYRTVFGLTVSSFENMKKLVT